MHEISQKLYKSVVLVCENRRDDGRESCGVTEPGLRAAIKEAMKAAGLPVRVLSTSCMDHCKEGPTVAIISLAQFAQDGNPSIAQAQRSPIFLGDVHIDDVPALVTKMAQYLQE
ncbi:MAG: (2Fe-2S) ferredoxin domain-containing protein [Patescibacteria group bacterium]